MTQPITLAAVTPIGTDIAHAVTVLRQGGLVALPTETVYGLGANARNPAAVAGIFAAKGRPATHPLIVHLASADELDQWAVDIPQNARDLAAHFWPGPLTLILPKHPAVSPAVTGGAATIGLRVPAHPTAAALLAAFGGGIAAPSANRFGAVSPTTAAHVAAELNGRIDYILDGGACAVGVESTIVDCSQPGAAPAILRPGGITRAQLTAVIGPLRTPTAAAPVVSGSLASHYAPNATVVVCAPHELAAVSSALIARAPGERLGVMAPQASLAAFHPPAATEVVGVPLPATAEAMAQRLYATLRDLDAAGCALIIAVLPSTDSDGLGEAIADRLQRAAGPRDRDPDKEPT